MKEIINGSVADLYNLRYEWRRPPSFVVYKGGQYSEEKAIGPIAIVNDLTEVRVAIEQNLLEVIACKAPLNFECMLPLTESEKNFYMLRAANRIAQNSRRGIGNITVSINGNTIILYCGVNSYDKPYAVLPKDTKYEVYVNPAIDILAEYIS